MKAKEFKNMLGVLAFPVAEKAGYSRNYWDHLVSTGKGIAKARVPAITAGIDEHIALLESVKKELLDD